MVHLKTEFFASEFVLTFTSFVSKSDNAGAADLFGTILPIGYTFSTLYGYCDFGERVTLQFDEFNEKFCQCNWYSFPLAMQRIYLISSVGIQDPVVIEGFASTTCTRDAFKKVDLIHISDLAENQVLICLFSDCEWRIFLSNDAPSN